jgi:hypothetical protein
VERYGFEVRHISSRDAPEVDHFAGAQFLADQATVTPPHSPVPLGARGVTQSLSQSVSQSVSHDGVRDWSSPDGDVARTKNGLRKRPPRAHRSERPVDAPTTHRVIDLTAAERDVVDDSPEQVRSRLTSLRSGVLRGQAGAQAGRPGTTTTTTTTTNGRRAGTDPDARDDEGGTTQG